MQLKDLDTVLPGKRRAISDIARFLSTRTDQNPNYTLLLGAGCSVSSGIRSAATLVAEWRREFCAAVITDPAEQRQYLKEHHANWYDPNREYSSLFEKKYDLQRQRRMFVETEVAGKTPSLGYAYLTALVGQNYFNTIFTTNFDDLINEAFYLYSDRRPIVCAHDSSIDSITITSKRPKLIKLHGDYLFDDLKSTARETESLEQNMKAKFAEFARDYGLVVVGYSAGDRSIMDAISSLLKTDAYFRNGIYWCLRKESEVSEELRKLLWKERVYFIEIDGFDELFAELYTTFNKGDVLPISTLTFSRRPADKVASLLRDQHAFHTDSPILQKAREELLRQSKRTTLMSMMVSLEKDDINELNDRLSDDELITELEIRNLLDSDNYTDAIAKCRTAIATTTRSAARRRILRLAISVHGLAGELSTAIELADQLIAYEPYQAAHLLLKASLLRNLDQKMAVINEAIAINPHYVPCYVEKARVCERLALRRVGIERDKLVATAYEQADIALRKDPSLTNPIWRTKLSIIRSLERDVSVKQKKVGELISRMQAMNPEAYRVLAARVDALTEDGDSGVRQALLNDLDAAKKHIDATAHADLEELRLRVLARDHDLGILGDALLAAEANHDPVHNPDLAVEIANLKRTKFALDTEAEQLLIECLKVNFDGDAARLLVETLTDLNRLSEARERLQKYSPRLADTTRTELLIDLLEAEGNFEGALVELAKRNTETGDDRIGRRLYFLLRMKRFSEAMEEGRRYLEARSFSLDFPVAIINYEIACKYARGKVGTHRLENLLKFERAPKTQAVIFILLGRKADMLDALEKAMHEDRTFRFEALRWPAFIDLQEDPDFLRAIAPSLKTDMTLKVVPTIEGLPTIAANG